MQVTAILAAAGRGERFGGGDLKQLVSVGGRPILERSFSTLIDHPSIDEVVVAAPQSIVESPPAYLSAASKPVRVVCGGARRQDSVANAFRAASGESEIIVIHDAARPFASARLIERTIAAAVQSGAAVAAIEARDTVKLVDRTARDAGGAEGGSSAGGLFVQATIPRATVYLAQTPQAFARRVLADALQLGGEATDEAALAERAGHRVVVIEGEASNIKITTPDDLPIAELIASERDATRPGRRAAKPARTGRAGTGYDLHRLVPDRPLVVGGVVIPSDRGAFGHSDADVVCHAVIDAMLGAAALGDIGRHFPDSDPCWKNASSLDLLARAARLVAAGGYEVGNVDVTVVLEKPKISGYIDRMRSAMAEALGIDAARVSIKGKTNEGVDAIGRGEAIAAHAIALVRSR